MQSGRNEGRMSPDDVRVVTQSWHRVGSFSDHAAILFYDRLFDTVPAARADFNAEQMPAARRLLIASIDQSVTRLSRDEAPTRREARKDEPADLLFGTGEAEILAALFWALHRVLGQGWTPAVEAAWRACAPPILAALRPPVTAS